MNPFSIAQHVLQTIKTHKEEMGDDFDYILLSPEEEEKKMNDIKLKLKEIPNDVLICSCMRVRKYDIKNSVILIEKFMKFRNEQNWKFELNELECETALQSNLHCILPGEDNDGRKILTMVTKNVDLECCTTKDYQKMTAMLLEKTVLNDKKVQEKGLVILLDFKDSSLKILRKMNVTDLIRGINVFRCFPIKVKKLISPN